MNRAVYIYGSDMGIRTVLQQIRKEIRIWNNRIPSRFGSMPSVTVKPQIAQYIYMRVIYKY